MDLLDPNVLNALAAGTAGAAMLVLARGYRLMERPREARCAACGRRVRRRSRCTCSD